MKKLESKLGCSLFNPACWLAIKLGFDGLCLSFNLPCPIGWLFNKLGWFFPFLREPQN